MSAIAITLCLLTIVQPSIVVVDISHFDHIKLLGQLEPIFVEIMFMGSSTYSPLFLHSLATFLPWAVLGLLGFDRMNVLKFDCQWPKRPFAHFRLFSIVISLFDWEKVPLQ